MNPNTREYHYYDVQYGGYTREYYVGEEAMQLRGVLKLMYPVEHGIIEDWTAMEKIWHYMFYTDMRIDPSEHPVAMLIRDMTPRPDIEKIAEILFETFNVPSLCLVSDGSAAMANVEKKTGIAVVLEDTYTSVVPCYDGFPLSHAIKKLEYSLHKVQEYLRRLLIANGKISKDLYWFRIYVQDMVDKLGSAFGQEGGRPARKVSYVLPDGDSIAMEGECDRCFDVYFRSDPAAFGFEGPTVQEAIVQSIEDAMAGWDDEADRKEFIATLAPITVVGPAARFPGIQERLTREFHTALPRAWRGGGKGGRPGPPDLSAVRFLVPDRPDLAAWRGLSRIARASAGDSRAWIQRREYLDNGPTVVHRLSTQEYVGR
jgi:actin